MSEGLKILHAEIKNFKNIESKVIDVNGMSLLVMGRNSAGKSSFIQALTSPMDSKILPSEPIRKGKPDEEISSIEVTIGGTMGGEAKKYVLTMYFTSGNKKGRLVVTNDAGEQIKAPATFVKSLIGNSSFDPTKWLNDSYAEQLKTFKRLTGCEIDIDKINAEVKDKKAVKKAKKEQAEEMEAVLKNHGYTQEQIDIYSTKKDIVPIQTELKNISKAIEDYASVESKMKDFKKAIADADKFIAEERAAIDKLKEQIAAKEKSIENVFVEIEKQKSNLVKGEEWFAKHSKPSAEEINTRLEEANKHNTHCDIIEKHAEQQRAMLKAKEAVTLIDSEIDVLEAKKSDLISKSQLPIAGVGFTDDQILIDGLPMEKGQINTARLFDIAVDVAIALKPNLKVIMLHEASLYDKENLRSIIKRIEDKGYMAVAEIVSEGDLEIKFSEEILK